ncbi:MAG: hypothetical protein ACD_5C00342G0002 [uncultured bacterium]|nr:MAG: hypothetical protein ACD_5C00342G0002 [uncultured bacterium]
MRNIFSIFIFTLISVIIVASSCAYETASPFPGEGPVQIAERLGVSPGKFIKLNLRLGNFKNPKRVSLIYTWQKFAIPLKEKEVVDSFAEKEDLKISTAKSPPYSDIPVFIQEQGVQKYIEQDYDNLKRIKLIALVIGLTLIFVYKKGTKKEKEADYSVTKFEDICLKALLLETGNTMYSKKQNCWDLDELFFVGRCRATGNLAVIHGPSQYQSIHNGARGLIEIGRFVVSIYGLLGIKNIQLEIPLAYADKYDSIINERKILLDFDNNSGSPSM